MTSRIALAAFAFLGCAAPARPVTRTPASPAPPPVRVAASVAPSSDVPVTSSGPPPTEPASASSDSPPPPLPPCGTEGYGFVIESPYDLPCDHFMHCRGAVRYRVRNCRETGALTTHLRVGPPGNGTLTLIDLAPIEPGGDMMRTINFGHEGSFDIGVHFTTEDGLDAAVMTTLIVTATERDRAVAACNECHGEWGRHGMMQIEGCICRTRDAGHECEDPHDCEGECLATGHRIVRPGHPPRPIGNGMLSVAEPLAVATGRCSEFRTAFGCHAVIPEGSRDRGPVPIRLLPRGMICRD